MSTMLEQAIIDANALREAALQNAESAIIEKYSVEVKEAVEKLLEQPEDFDMMGAEEEESVLDEVPPASTEDLELCPCPDDKEQMSMEFTMKDLKRISKEMEEGEPEEVEKLAAKLGAEDEDEASLQESQDQDDDVVELDEDLELDEEILFEYPEESLEEEIVEEEEELDEELVSELVEELIVDLSGDDLTGWAGRPGSDIAYAEEVRLARLASTENQEKIETMKKSLDGLMEQKGSLQKENNQLKEAVVYLKNKLDEVNLQNAKLHYVNRTLNSVSLNERQKDKIVESIQGSETMEEAKVIFETLQSAVGSSTKQPKSLSEAIQRPSLSARRRKNSIDDRNTAAKQRFQRLAGIVKD